MFSGGLSAPASLPARTVVVPVGEPSGPGHVTVTLRLLTSQPMPVPGPALATETVYFTVWSCTRVVAGSCVVDNWRRFALQFAGEWCAHAWLPPTKTKSNATPMGTVNRHAPRSCPRCLVLIIAVPSRVSATLGDLPEAVSRSLSRLARPP